MACVMTGGATVDSEEDARFLSKQPELADREIDVGDEVELPPCVPEHYLAIWRAKGRSCPRPGLAMDPETGPGLDLMQVSLAEHTRHMFEGVLRDLVPAGERPVLRRRVLAALRDPVVTERLFPKRDDED